MFAVGEHLSDTGHKLEGGEVAVIASRRKATSEGEFVRPWKFCASPYCSIKTIDLNFWPYTGMFDSCKPT